MLYMPVAAHTRVALATNFQVKKILRGLGTLLRHRNFASLRLCAIASLRLQQLSNSWPMARMNRHLQST